MAGIYTGLAAVIAFGVIYNSARISLSERARELASLRVLGFTNMRGIVDFADRACVAHVGRAAARLVDGLRPCLVDEDTARRRIDAGSRGCGAVNLRFCQRNRNHCRGHVGAYRSPTSQSIGPCSGPQDSRLSHAKELENTSSLGPCSRIGGDWTRLVRAAEANPCRSRNCIKRTNGSYCRR